MGQPVVHFEVVGGDGEQLRNYYSELFDWNINADNPLNYGIVDREENTSDDGIGIGGGIAGDMMPGYSGHVTIYVQVPDVEAGLAKAEALGGKRLMGPDAVPGDGPVIGQFEDPAGHMIGLIQG